MLRKLLLSTLLATVASSAMAADMWAPMSAPAPYMAAPAPYDWTGFYVGVNGGYDWSKQSFGGVSYGGTTIGVSGLPSVSLDGVTAGGTVGSNLQYGNTVFGLEGDLDWSNSKGTLGLRGTDISLNDNDDYSGTVRGRVGYAFGRLLPYVTGGLYWQRSKATISSPTYLGPYGVSVNDTSVGWTLGGGVEYALTNNWSVKAEYLYARANPSFASTTSFGSVALKINGDVNIVRAGVNYKF